MGCRFLNLATPTLRSHRGQTSTEAQGSRAARPPARTELALPLLHGLPLACGLPTTEAGFSPAAPQSLPPTASPTAASASGPGRCDPSCHTGTAASAGGRAWLEDSASQPGRFSPLAPFPEPPFPLRIRRPAFIWKLLTPFHAVTPFTVMWVLAGRLP